MIINKANEEIMTEDLIGELGYYINPYYNNEPVWVLVLKVNNYTHVNVIVLTDGIYRFNKQDPIFKTWKPGSERLMAINVIVFLGPE